VRRVNEGFITLHVDDNRIVLREEAGRFRNTLGAGCAVRRGHDRLTASSKYGVCYPLVVRGHLRQPDVTTFALSCTRAELTCRKVARDAWPVHSSNGRLFAAPGAGGATRGGRRRGGGGMCGGRGPKMH
jgi:hypothetical protein